MTFEELLQLPLNVYIIIVGIGLFVLLPCLVFCCCFIRVKREAARRYVYNKVVLKGAGKTMFFVGQTCPVCLEDFKTKEELGVCPCTHAFHKKCLQKWLEVRSVCPMCNKPVCRLHPEPDPEQG